MEMKALPHYLYLCRPPQTDTFSVEVACALRIACYTDCADHDVSSLLLIAHRLFLRLISLRI